MVCVQPVHLVLPRDIIEAKSHGTDVVRKEAAVMS